MANHQSQQKTTHILQLLLLLLRLFPFLFPFPLPLSGFSVTLRCKQNNHIAEGSGASTTSVPTSSPGLLSRASLVPATAVVPLVKLSDVESGSSSIEIEEATITSFMSSAWQSSRNKKEPRVTLSPLLPKEGTRRETGMETGCMRMDA